MYGFSSITETDPQASPAVAALLAGTTAANDTLLEITNIAASKAPLASPSFTGSIGIGVAAPSTSALHVLGSGASTIVSLLEQENASAATQIVIRNTAAANVLNVASYTLGTKSDTTDRTALRVDGFYHTITDATRSSTGRFITTSNGVSTTVLTLKADKVGVNAIAPSAFLQVVGITEQLRLGYDNTVNYASLTVSSTGKLSIVAAGTAPSIIIGASTAMLLGFYGLATGVAQRAGASQIAITDSTGGSTADQTIVDVTTTGIADPVKVNNNFAKVTRLVNEIRAALTALSLVKGAA